MSSSHLLHFYITVISPVLEYCAPLWHYALTKAQSESLEAVQKRAIRIVHIRAVATFEATEAAASVVFRTVASVKAILLPPF